MRMVARSLLASLAFGALLAANQGVAQVAAKKEDVGALGGKWYGTAELRHHLNTYYDPQGYYARQEPSLHARLQFGAQFYEGMIDAYATLGAFKAPETQQIMQRRPELALDLYPLRGAYLTVLQYNLVQFPVKDEATLPLNEDDRSDLASATGSIYTFGLAPTFKYSMPAGSSRIDFKAGLDGWTRLYSRRQYAGPSTLVEEGDEGRLGLASDEDGGGEDAEPIEDYALHYRSQVFAGAGLEPGVAKGFTTEVTAHHHSRFDPRYSRGEDGGVDYSYAATRYSYYRLRLRYELTERLAIANDFYHFFDGAFQGKRDGEERRFRNIVRLSCKL